MADKGKEKGDKAAKAGKAGKGNTIVELKLVKRDEMIKERIAFDFVEEYTKFERDTIRYLNDQITQLRKEREILKAREKRLISLIFDKFLMKGLADEETEDEIQSICAEIVSRQVTCAKVGNVLLVGKVPEKAEKPE